MGQRRMRCIAKFGKIDASFLREFSQNDPLTSWLETLKDMATNREQQWSCCHFLSNPND